MQTASQLMLMNLSGRAKINNCLLQEDMTRHSPWRGVCMQ